MFKDLIRSTALSTEAAEMFFEDKINGMSFSGDNSFVSTLRGLLYSRMPAEDSIYYANSTTRITKEYIDGHSVDDVLYKILEPISVNETNRISLRMFAGEPEDYKTVLDIVDSYFVGYANEIYDGWTRFERVTALFEKAFSVTCYINEPLKSVIIFAQSLSMKKYHLLQCSLLGMMPWYFNPSAGISDEEMEFINSLRKETPDVYLACIKSIAEKYNFEEARLKKLLDGFETRFEKAEIENVKREIERARGSIENYNREIADLLKSMHDKQVRLLGLTESAKEKGENSEIFEYFSRNKHLYLDNTSGTTITFSTKDYLLFFDEEVVKRVLGNIGSYVYEYNSSRGISNEDIKKLSEALFIDRTMNIKFCARYKIDLNAGIFGCKNVEFDKNLFDGYMPNPHIQYYACLGDYGPRINQLLADGAYLEAIEQAIVSGKCLNFADSCVMSSFYRDLCEEKYKCIELPDGTCVSTKDAIAWLHSQEKSNEPKTEE